MPRGRQSWKGTERLKHGSKKKKKKSEHESNSKSSATNNSSSSSSSIATGDLTKSKSMSSLASLLIPQREKWTEAPAYVRGYWDINQIEGDPALEQLIANNYFLGCADLEPLQWAIPGSDACKAEVRCLSEMCRDSELHARGVSPETPLRYLEKLASMSPSSFARPSIRNVIMLLNGDSKAHTIGVLVLNVLTMLGTLVFDDIGAYIRDTTRADSARICAVRIVEIVCLRGAYGPAWRRGGFILMAALGSDCRENSIPVNTALAAALYEIRYTDGLPAIKKAIDVGRVTPKIAANYKDFAASSTSSSSSSSSSSHSHSHPSPLGSSSSSSSSSSTSLTSRSRADDLLTIIRMSQQDNCPHCGEPVDVCSKRLTLMGSKLFKKGLKSLNMGYCDTACSVMLGGIAWLPQNMQNHAMGLYAEALLLLERYEEAASALSESNEKSQFPLHDALAIAEIQRLNGHLVDALQTFASVATVIAASPNGKGYISVVESYLKHLLEQEDGYNDERCVNVLDNVHDVIVADWDHPIVFPALPLQVSSSSSSSSSSSNSSSLAGSAAASGPSASNTLAVSEKCFAVISSQHKVEVGQFNDPFSYYSKVSSSKTTTTTTSSTSTSTTKDNRRPFSPLRSIKSLGVEGCKALSADPSGSAVAAIVRDSQNVTVWELKADYSREVPLGPALRPPERIVCGGHLGGVVAASSQGVVTVWHWAEPEESSVRGPFYLAATRGRVTAMAIDATARISDGEDDDVQSPYTYSTRPSSLFAAVREPKRTCILEYDLRTQTLSRTLLGITPVLRSTDPPPVFPLPVVATVACCPTHVAASTLCGSLHVWERRSNPSGRKKDSSSSSSCSHSYNTSVRYMFCIESLLESSSRAGSLGSAAAGSSSGSGASSASSGSGSVSGGGASMGCAVSLAFIPGVLLCGLQCGQVVGYDICHPGPQEQQNPLFRIKGPSLPISSISPLIRGSELLVRVAYSGCLISTFLFNLREKGAETKRIEGPFKCAGCEKMLDPLAPLMKCGGCMKVYYCSLKCQKNDWKKHSLICKYYD